MPPTATLLVILATVCCTIVAATTYRPECQALLRLYASTNGPSWSSNGGWGVPTDCCAWNGVVCTSANVTYVSLGGSGLTGTLPPSLTGLDFLLELLLSNNAIAGTLPSSWGTGELPSLTALDISDNRLVGGVPAEWSAFTADLKLQHNALDGSFASTAANPLKAHTLDVSFNHLTGSLPCGLFMQAKFNNNKFSGSIPVDCFNITSYSNYCFLVDLSFNELSGTLDPRWTQNAVSEYCGNLFMHNNQLEGPIDASIQLNNNNGNTLQMTLDHNNFTGSVPCGILSASLSFNQLSGSLPLCPGLTYNTVQLANNRLSGTLPDAWGSQFYGSFDLSWNQLEGTIPASWYLRGVYNSEVINVSHNLLTGTIPDVPTEAVGAYLGLDFSSNRLTGTIPASWFSAFNPSAVNVSHNALSGSVNVSFAHGPNAYVFATSIDLSHNDFSGTPILAYAPPALATFVLEDNRFSGTFNFDALPAAMRNATNRAVTCARITDGNSFCGPSTVCPVHPCK